MDDFSVLHSTTLMNHQEIISAEETNETIENSIEFVLNRLNSNDNKIIIETIVQIKNLIIGNNKYKSFYLKENLVNFLIEMINKQFDIKQQNRISEVDSYDLINQILIIFASFSLGNLEHIINLVKLHGLHELLFSLLKLDIFDFSNPNKLNVRLIESSLRCLANLYTSCQLVPSLIYTMDKCLYNSINSTDNSQSYLDLLLKYYSLSNMTKQSVITIISISSNIISIALTSSNRYLISLLPFSSVSQQKINSSSINIENRTENIKSKNTTYFRLVKIDEQLRKNRNLLLKSECINKFAHLLTSLLEPVQLHTLKFYSSICFENAEAARIVLATNYYDYSLIDLISAYLSRENSAELQLKAAICLTNLCRSLLKLTFLKTNKQISRPRQQNIPTMTMTTRSRVSTLRKVNKIKLEETSSSQIEECETELKQSIKSDDSCLYKLVDYSSQLIRLRTLPTLVRLCCMYSALYRNNNSSNLNQIGQNFDLYSANSRCQNNKVLNQQSYLNLFLLIQSISTLTYLIELNSDLQTTASCLEQIIPTLAFNIVDAYSIFDSNKLKSYAKAAVLKRINISGLQSNKLNNELNFKKRRLFDSVEKINFINKKTNKSNQTSSSSSSSSTSSSASSSSTTSTSSSVINKYPENPSNIIEYSSLFSLFYLNYNQYATKGCQFKLNEHQYRQLSSLNFNPVDFITNKSTIDYESSKQKNEIQRVKIMERVNSYLCMLNQTIHKRLASVSFHALAALAANNEEARRQISENSGLISRLIDSVNLKQQDENDENLKSNSLDDLNYLKLDDFLTDLKMEQENDEINEEHNEDDIDECELIDELEEDFDDLNQTDADLLRLSGLCLLHSLSRSVHQLRTKFLDKKIWLPILDLIKRGRQRRIENKNLIKKRKSFLQIDQQKVSVKKRDSNEFLSNKEEDLISEETSKNLMVEKELISEDIESNQDSSRKMIKTETESEDSDLQEEHVCDGNLNEQNLISITTAILANLLLDFSPSKETMIENGIVKILVELIDHKNQSIKVNCMWSLMNLAFQADQKTKLFILSTITMEKLFQLLLEQDETLVLKTMGLIRNIISNRSHIDSIMTTCGTKIIQAIVMILESEYYNSNIKEQALCVLSNIADGQSSKELIMNNEDLLRKINSFMTHNSVELQLASVYCVSNLVCSNEEGASERQSKLKEMGVQKILQKLLQSVDPILFDKVKLTLQQFSSSSLQSLSSSSSSSTSSLINSGSTTNLH